MANVQSKMVGGVEFIAPMATNQIHKLATLEQDLVAYRVVNIDPVKTKFNSFIVTVEKGDEEFRVWMPEYIAKHAKPNSVFVYAGLQPKLHGSGHNYHSVLWAKDE